MTQRFTDCTEQKRACPIKHHITGAATERKCCLNTLRSNSSFMHSSWNKLGVPLSKPAIMLANSPCMSVFASHWDHLYYTLNSKQLCMFWYIGVKYLLSICRLLHPTDMIRRILLQSSQTHTLAHTHSLWTYWQLWLPVILWCNDRNTLFPDRRTIKSEKRNLFRN